MDTHLNFWLERGVRQSCPLSGSLFVLCAEILANAIRSDNTTKGIKIHDKEFKLSQYGDDTTAFVSDKKSATNVFKLLSNFQECSGLEKQSNLYWAAILGDETTGRLIEGPV